MSFLRRGSQSVRKENTNDERTRNFNNYGEIPYAT
jgi:hypothetical protein